MLFGGKAKQAKQAVQKVGTQVQKAAKTVEKSAKKTAQKVKKAAPQAPSGPRKTVRCVPPPAPQSGAVPARAWLRAERLLRPVLMHASAQGARRLVEGCLGQVQRPQRVLRTRPRKVPRPLLRRGQHPQLPHRRVRG